MLFGVYIKKCCNKDIVKMIILIFSLKDWKDPMISLKEPLSTKKGKVLDKSRTWLIQLM